MDRSERRRPGLLVSLRSRRAIARRGPTRSGDATWGSRRKIKPGLGAFLRGEKFGGGKPRNGQAVSRETTPPRQGNDTLGRRRVGYFGGNFEESNAAKRARGGAAISVPSRDEGKTVGREKPMRGSAGSERKRGRCAVRTPGGSKALKAKSRLRREF